MKLFRLCLPLLFILPSCSGLNLTSSNDLNKPQIKIIDTNTLEANNQKILDSKTNETPKTVQTPKPIETPRTYQTAKPIEPLKITKNTSSTTSIIPKIIQTVKPIEPLKITENTSSTTTKILKTTEEDLKNVQELVKMAQNLQTSLISGDLKTFETLTKNIEDFKIAKGLTKPEDVMNIIKNIETPQGLTNIEDIKSKYIKKTEDNISFSSVIVNGKSEIKFESERLIISFFNDNSFKNFKNLYTPVIESELDGFYLIKFDTSKISLLNFESLLYKYNKIITEPINTITFSSLSSMYTFTVYMDMIINHSDLVQSVEFNMIPELY